MKRTVQITSIFILLLWISYVAYINSNNLRIQRQSSIPSGGPIQNSIQSFGVIKVTEINKQFVGNTRSNVYHYPWCSIAQEIRPEYQIWFKDSEDARAHGYQPCQICNPP